MTAPTADLLFTDGPVYDPGQPAPRPDAVAVRGGVIVARGEAARQLAGPRTRRVDLRGRLLIPGFQDAHVHAVFGGLELGQCDLTALTDPAALLDRIAAYAAENPRAAWITGAGWSLESFPGGLPTAAQLDRAVPDRPALLHNRDHHGAWANSRALELAGITAATPDPADGRIERDARGEPTGMLQEGAVGLVARLLPELRRADLDAALLRAQRLLHSLGITAWQDALVGRAQGMADNYAVYRDAAAAGTLTARVRGALWWDRGRGREQIAELEARRAAGRIGRFEPGTVKIMQDGIIENRTAALIDPYLNPAAAACGCRDGATASADRGLSFVDPDLLPGYVTELDRLGFQVHFHALGDRAVREALDAVEAARAANGESAQRHHLAHLQVVHPDDVPRFKRLGAVANIQPLWAAHEPQLDELAIPVLGPERTARQYPFGDLLRSGAALAAGSDWPVSSADPIAGIHVAVNRSLPGRDGEPFLPGQRLTLAEAVTAYTAGSAWANHLDDTGSLRVGAHADLAVLDRDPFAAPATEIHAARVEAAFVGGEEVWSG
jgi:predicted amidohydrolase YtcJ